MIRKVLNGLMISGGKKCSGKSSNFFRNVHVWFHGLLSMKYANFFTIFTHLNQTAMGKEKSVVKEKKKEPTKSLKEKRAAKKEKKAAKK